MRAPAVLSLIAAFGIAGGGYAYWLHQQTGRIPSGLASANGRIEVERVDIAAKFAGRVAEIRVKEGDFVRKDQIIARLDTAEPVAQLAAAKATARRAAEAIGRAQAELAAAHAALRRATEAIGKARADVAIREAEHNLSEVEWRRAVELERRSVTAPAEVDRRKAQHLVAEAQILGARAAVRDAEAAREAAEAQVLGATAAVRDAEAAREAAVAQVALIEAMLADMTLRTPVAGRVEYKLVQPSEVVAAGGRLVTILDLTDVFMTVFLPTSQAGQVALGSEARIVLDAAPSYVIPATVSFVAAEAQFTPKAVETPNEREKLMYRVKLAIDPKLLETYRDYVKAGLTGNAYVKVAASAAWPAHLAPRLPEIPAPAAPAGPEAPARISANDAAR